ncbi:MAG: GTP 3',8-cyclase MoaA [Pelagibacterales bacterium]|nr:GTP 3',8-cyclase MoaA [Pelagibacterales bacterium]PPR15834.1 MAG: Cyclic pyranopterin monophosphate synthase [Alphaproteobacteria bacterium MarineAlpha9_Bin3]|tara:strand:- start:2155 stop:3186 length:1032 start_codon:yes stop_codon:yes gene_type:complete
MLINQEEKINNNISPLMDPFGRAISYLRVSLTDRCDFRCVYCMSENMSFLPKSDVLSLEEIETICTSFINLGTKKIRLTGGEPLVRKNVLTLIKSLGSRIGSGLEELTITTNGSQLSRFSDQLYEYGVRRVNVSIDTLKPELFKKITRWGNLEKVLNGLKAATKAGLKCKINAVALKDVNEDELQNMIEWAHNEGHDFTIIETMPMGEISEDRTDQYLPLSLVRANLRKKFTLTESEYKTGGPARYVKIKETGGRLGFITPLTHNFCESCNRVRLTCTGMLYMCLGQDDSANLRKELQDGKKGIELEESIREAILRKPKGHDFEISRRASGPAVKRHMSVTGG